jgi:hypothetical protein
MRLTVMLQTAKGPKDTLGEGEELYRLRQPTVETPDHIRWYLWHENLSQALPNKLSLSTR